MFLQWPVWQWQQDNSLHIFPNGQNCKCRKKMLYGVWKYKIFTVSVSVAIKPSKAGNVFTLYLMSWNDCYKNISLLFYEPGIFLSLFSLLTNNFGLIMIESILVGLVFFQFSTLIITDDKHTTLSLMFPNKGDKIWIIFTFRNMQCIWKIVEMFLLSLFYFIHSMPM